MILFKNRWITVAETRFGPPLSVQFSQRYSSATYPGIDVLYFLQSPEPVPGAQCEEAHTLLHALQRDPEILFEDIHKTTRYEIQRAREKDHVTYECWRQPDFEKIADFCEFFSRFAGQKGIPKASANHLATFAKQGSLALSQVRAESGEPLSWHVHLVEKGRSRLLNSASARITDDNQFRNLVSRANRFHHWEDILSFREEGCHTYDFGGWYSGQTDPTRLQINQFKERFGGTPEKSYNCALPLTWRGKSYLLLKKLARAIPKKGALK